MSTRSTRWLLLVVCGIAALGCVDPEPTPPSAQPGDGTFWTGEIGQYPMDLPADDPRAREQAEALLERIAMHFGADASELRLVEAEEDDLGKLHIVYEQVHRGRVIEGATLAVHVRPDGSVYAANGSIRGTTNLPSEARVSADAAKSTVRGRYSSASLSEPELVYWVSVEGPVHLVWVVEATDEAQSTHDRVYVDAITGDVIGHRSFTPHAMQRVLRHERGTLIDWTEQMPPPAGEHADTFERMRATYACLFELFGRDGINGRGGPLTLRLTSTPDNAYWHEDTQSMEFGIGTGGRFEGPFERSGDVVTHEFSHGLLYAAANLQYDWGSDASALHEGMSDVFAAVCDWHREGRMVTDRTFLLAEDIFTPGTPGDAMRYYADPALDGASWDFYQPGVPNVPHYMGGVVRLAFYLAAQGGRHPRRDSSTVSGVGMERAAQIFYRAVDVYFTERTTYPDARASTVLAASELYDDVTVRAIEAAWDAVGVRGTPRPPTPPTPGRDGGSDMIFDAGVDAGVRFDAGRDTGVDAGVDAEVPDDGGMNSTQDGGSQMARTPERAGELTFTEIMYDPRAVSDAAGEWFEMVNTTSDALELTGCRIVTRTTTQLLERSLVIAPGALVTFARSSAAGFDADAELVVALSNTSGQVGLVCDGTTIDFVSYQSSGFPSADGSSIQVTPGTTYVANDSGSSWCRATEVYSTGDRGTPARVNPSCR